MTETETIALPEETPAGRILVPIVKSWKFYKGTAAGAHRTDFDDTSWARTDLPHTWNNIDGEDGGNDYYRGTGWYRKAVHIEADAVGKRIYIEFKGVNSQMELFVNGVFAGSHKGGYTAFRFDITQYIDYGRANLLAVKASNAVDPAIAPLSGDFTFFGGIYREVSLLFVESVHIDLDCSGSPGVFLKAQYTPGEAAFLHIESFIQNDAATPKEIQLRILLRHPERFSQNEYENEYLTPNLRFRPQDMGGGAIVAVRERLLRIEPGAGKPVSETIAVAAPHLWNGLADPYRYQVELSVLENGTVLDSFTGFVGFRSFSVDKDRGFYLNGKPYPLRGVAMHQDYRGKGNAVSFREMTESFSFLYEIGANTVRLSHYPHSPYMYELCDKYGIVVYAEIPFVNTYGGGGTWETPNPDLEEFIAVTKQQLTEMIRQEYNVSAIFCWGLYNEAQKSDHAVMVPLVRALNDLAHSLDDTRPTVTATFSEEGELLQSDLLAWNTYPPPQGLRDNAERFYQAMDGRNAADHMEKYAPFYIRRYDEAGYYSGVLERPVGISEYGIGGSIHQHTDDYTMGSGTIKIQPEEFQAYCHEMWIHQIRKLDYLWGTYVWNLFDFSADNRDEATVPGVNTKGLVSRDRKTRKDAFYIYKAFWRTDRNVLSITGKNNTVRETNPTYFKIYANCEAVTLFVDGREYGTRRQEDNALCCVFEWPWTEDLSYGEHVIRAVGRSAGKETVSDEMRILRKKSAATNPQTDSAPVDPLQKRLRITVPSEVRRFEKTKLTDGDPATRWAGRAVFPAELLLDFGEPVHLSGICIDWFEEDAYRYRILAGVSNCKDVLLSDHTANSASGTIRSSFPSVSARYVKIEVTGSAGGSGWISAHSISADAWQFRTSYAVDEEMHTILVPYHPQIVISKEEFINALGLEGNCTAQVVTGAAATVYYITDGAVLEITCGSACDRYRIVYR